MKIIFGWGKIIPKFYPLVGAAIRKGANVGAESVPVGVVKLICLIAHFSVTCPAGLFFTSIYLKLLCCRPLALCDRITVAASAPRY